MDGFGGVGSSSGRADGPDQSGMTGAERMAAGSPFDKAMSEAAKNKERGGEPRAKTGDRSKAGAPAADHHPAEEFSGLGSSGGPSNAIGGYEGEFDGIGSSGGTIADEKRAALKARKEGLEDRLSSAISVSDLQYTMAQIDDIDRQLAGNDLNPALGMDMDDARAFMTGAAVGAGIGEQMRNLKAINIATAPGRLVREGADFITDQISDWENAKKNDALHHAKRR